MSGVRGGGGDGVLGVFRRHRRGVFTLNNYTQAEEDGLRELATGPLKVLSYLVYGKELAPSTGTPHLQGYFEGSARVRGSVLRGTTGFARAWLQPARGTQKQCIDYCKKDGDWKEWGEPRAQGQRTDLAAIQEEIDGGATEEEIAGDYFGRWCIYRRSFGRYRQLKRGRKRDSSVPVEVYYIYGDTGTGKTRLVYDMFPDCYRHAGSDKFFDGYSNQEVALFDDAQPDMFTVSKWLQVLDRYPLQVEVKGSIVDWTPITVILTTNLELHEFVHEWAPRHRDAFRRRITHVHHMQ